MCLKLSRISLKIIIFRFFDTIFGA